MEQKLDRDEQLAEYEQLYRTVFEKSVEGIIIAETEEGMFGKIVAANQVAARMHGYTIEELTNKNVSDLHTPESAEGDRRAWEHMQKGEWIMVEHDHIRKDGSIFPTRYHAGIIKFHGRRCIISFNLDMSEQKQAQDALEKCESQLAMMI